MSDLSWRSFHDDPYRSGGQGAASRRRFPLGQRHISSRLISGRLAADMRSRRVLAVQAGSADLQVANRQMGRLPAPVLHQLGGEPLTAEMAGFIRKCPKHVRRSRYFIHAINAAATARMPISKETRRWVSYCVLAAEARDRTLIDLITQREREHKPVDTDGLAGALEETPTWLAPDLEALQRAGDLTRGPEGDWHVAHDARALANRPGRRRLLGPRQPISWPLRRGARLKLRTSIEAVDRARATE